MNFNPSKLFGCRYLYRRILGFVSLVLVFCSVTSQALADDEQEIRAAFLLLQRALLAHDGNQAVGLVSSDTKDYYRMLSSIASSKTSLEELKKANLTSMNLIMVKYAKKTLPKSFWSDYKKSNPDKLLKHAVDRGLGSQELTNNVRLGTIKLNGQTAVGKLVKGPKVLPLQMEFKKESGQWKVSLLSMFEQANSMAEGFMKRAGLKTEDIEKMIVQ